MNAGRTIFAQLMDFVPPYEFRKCVDRYQGHYKVQRFSCWDQFLFLAFAPTGLISASMLPRVTRLSGRWEASAGRLTLRRAARPS